MTRPFVPLRSVTVQLQLDPVVYRALLKTATIQDTQVHTLIERKLLAAYVGVAPTEEHTRVSKAEIARWKALWALGWSDSAIAREAGRRQNIVSRHLRREGCPARGKGGAKPKQATVIEDQEAAA